MAGVVEDILKPGGMARHFETHVEALFHFELGLYVVEGLLGDVHDAGGAQLPGEGEAEGIDVGDDDVPCAGELADRGGHTPDGTGARDEHVFRHEVPREGGVDRVAEGVEGGGEFLRDGGVELVDVAVGQGEEIRKGSRPVHSDAFGVGAEVAAPGEAISAAPAHEVALTGHVVTGHEVGDAGTDPFHVPAILVADGHGDWNGFLRPVVPVPDVEVGSADGGFRDANQHVHRSDLGLRDIEQIEAGFGPGFDEGSHGAVEAEKGPECTPNSLEWWSLGVMAFRSSGAGGIPETAFVDLLPITAFLPRSHMRTGGPEVFDFKFSVFR